ncbi:MAG: glutamate--cysteine ligase [Myxococcota bacterium]
MSLVRQDPELERPIDDLSQLTDYFRRAEKPRERWRIGTEHEKVGLYADTLDPVPYEGPRGIRRLLEILRDEHGFEALVDEGLLVGLERDGTTITLEPGGQLELSGAPLLTMFETCGEFRDHLALMKHVSSRLGILWLGLGIHPRDPVERVPRMPRKRHEIMRRFLAPRGKLAPAMMHQTACVQANLDYASPLDMARKLRVATAISPIVTALYANSSISLGRPNGFESKRAFIWRHTDPARCGILPFVFEEDFLESGRAYQAYADWALDIPMMMLQRGEEHLALDGRTFRVFVEQGYEGLEPILADWHLHLTTLFPEVRLKRVIEVRGADGVPPDLVCALSAFWKGILYDPVALDATLERVAPWSFEAVDRMHEDVARRGLSAAGPAGEVLAEARALLPPAAEGLQRIGIRNAEGRDESLLLDPLFEIAERGTSPGREIVRLWEGAWGQKLERLVEYARY